MGCLEKFFDETSNTGCITVSDERKSGVLIFDHQYTIEFDFTNGNILGTAIECGETRKMDHTEIFEMLYNHL